MRPCRQIPPAARPLVLPALAWLGGIAAGGTWPNLWIPIVVATAGISLAWLWIGSRLNKSLLPALVAACLAAGTVAISFWHPGRITDRDVACFAGPTWWKITGTLTGPPLKSAGRIRLVLAVESIQNRKKSIPATGRLLVNIMGQPRRHFLPGDRIRFTGRIKPFYNFDNPGNFDYRRYMAFKGIHARSYCRPEKVTFLSVAHRFSLKRQLAIWRNHLGKELSRALAGYDESVRAVAAALLLGDRSQVTAKLRRDFARAGAAHVLAISGLHLGLVAAGSLVLLTWLLAWCRPLRDAAMVRRAAAMGAFLPTAAYALLAGMSPSTQRALIMVAVFLAAIVIGRRHDLYNSLALAALVITAAYPPALFSISFQLSFAAVIGIVWLLERLDGHLPAPKSWPARQANRLLWLALVNLAAMASTAPLVIRNFNQLSLVGGIANLAVVPLVGLVVLPAGLAGVFVCHLWPAAAAWLLKLSGLGLVPALKVIENLAAAKHAAVTMVTPTWLEIGLYYLAVWSLVQIKRSRWALRLLLAVALVAAADSTYWIYQRYFRDDLRLTLVDVGQGSCALAELPGGYTILIDGGGFSDNQVFDIGRRVVAPFLWNKKIATIDLVILSHANSDHLNGLLYILENFSPAMIWSNHQGAPTLAYRHFSALIARRKIPWPALEELPRRTVINKVAVDILHPRPRDLADCPDLNANSLVIRLQLGKIGFLLPGDITAAAERRILKRLGTRKLASTVLVAAHHGSRHSNSPALLKAVAPKWVAISCGKANRFGFPHRQVLARLKRLGCRVLRTDCCGAICFVTNGRKLAVTTFVPGCPCPLKTP